jgi:hypothetical protein
LNKDYISPDRVAAERGWLYCIRIDKNIVVSAIF